MVALEKQAPVEPEFPYALRYTVISNTLKGIQKRYIKKSRKTLNDGAFQNSIIGYLPEVAFWWDIQSHEKNPHPRKIPGIKIPGPRGINKFRGFLKYPRDLANILGIQIP